MARWFQTNLSIGDRCEILEGDDFANKVVARAETPEIAAAIVAEHNVAEASVVAQKIVTKYAPPAIPVRCFDWTAVADDYEPGDLIGYGYTEAEAIADLRELIAEREEAA